MPREVTKIDSMHYNLSTILGYQKAFNAIISEREDGKTTAVFLHTRKKFKEGHPTILIRRQIVDVTETYIEDNLKILNKFVAEFDRSKIFYKKTEIKEGIVDVFYDKKHLYRILGLSKKLSTLKAQFVANCELTVMDEFICNTRCGEKYLKDEAFKFKELFNTFQRESKGKMKAIFMGNPYSLYNPYFVWWGVDTSKLKRGSIVVGEEYIIECHEITKELREFILARNPLYKFDDAYTKYAFGAQNINDSNIRILTNKPSGYALQYALRIDGKLLGIWENQDYTNPLDRFYVNEIQDISNRKNIYCFEYNDLMNRTALVSYRDKAKFASLKSAFSRRKVDFQNLSCYYLLEEFYPNL